MRMFLLSTLVLVIGCGLAAPVADPSASAPLTNGTAPLTAAADVENGLPYDGCSYPVTVAGVAYAPSPSSRALVAAFAPQFGHAPAVIEYRLTGGTAEVECGWGSMQRLPEIEIISIAAPAALTAEAVIVNGLPYDGCSYPVTLDGVQYAPSTSSAAAVAAFAQQIGENRVTIEYRLTGATAQVECGWGSVKSLPEIEILTLRPRT